MDFMVLAASRDLTGELLYPFPAVSKSHRSAVYWLSHALTCNVGSILRNSRIL